MKTTLTKVAPPVSIGIPVRNGARYLAETLDSLLAQTFTDFEIVISDNVSTDDTEAICRAYVARDERIRYVRAARASGAPTNYNRVFDLAKGRYFKWNAADDLCDPNVLQRCFDVLEAERGVVLAYPTTKIIDEASQVVSDYDDRLELDFERPSDRFHQLLLRVAECNAVFGLVRANTLRRTPRIGQYFSSDMVLLVELALHGRFRSIPDTYFYRRDHVEASSRYAPEPHMAFWEVRSRLKFDLRTWRRVGGVFSALMRAPVPLRERMRAIRLLARHAWWTRSELMDDLREAWRTCRSRRR